MNWLVSIIVGLSIAMIATGVGLFIYFKIKPKRETWSVVVYHLSNAEFTDDFKNDKGELIVHERKLTKLVPKDVDLLIFDGQDFRLRDSGLTIANVDADSLNDFRNVIPLKKKVGRYVEVLIEQGSATIIKSGYDNALGVRVWFPMPYDRASALTADYRSKSSRYQEQISNWLKALPYVAVVLLCVTIMVVGVSMSQAYVKVQESSAESVADLSDAIRELRGNVKLPDNPKNLSDNKDSGG